MMKTLWVIANCGKRRAPEVLRRLGEKAAQAGIEYLSRKVNGRGGIIVIDRHGLCASRYTTKKMVHGWIEKGDETFSTFSAKK